jgi:hypothetical protein
MANGISLKKNPDESARNAKPQMYTQSLEGGPPSTEYARRATPLVTGPNQVIPSQKAPRNGSGNGNNK